MQIRLVQIRFKFIRSYTHKPPVMRVISLSLGLWSLEKSEHVDHTCREETLSQDNGWPRRLNLCWHFTTRKRTRVKENAHENAALRQNEAEVETSGTL